MCRLSHKVGAVLGTRVSPRVDPRARPPLAMACGGPRWMREVQRGLYESAARDIEFERWGDLGMDSPSNTKAEAAPLHREFVAERQRRANHEADAAPLEQGLMQGVGALACHEELAAPRCSARGTASPRNSSSRRTCS